MRVIRSTAAVTVMAAAALGSAILTGTAHADTGTTLTVGPVPVPSVPVSLCVRQTELRINTCLPGPTLSSVSLTITADSATPTVALTRPTITRIACPAGTSGAAARVTTGSAAATVRSVVTGTTSLGQRVNIGLQGGVVAPNRTVTYYACTGVS